MANLVKTLKAEMAKLVELKDEYWERWSAADAWSGADPATFAAVSSLALWRVPHRANSLPDMMTYRLGELEQLDPSVAARLDTLIRSDISR